MERGEEVVSYLGVSQTFWSWKALQFLMIDHPLLSMQNFQTVCKDQRLFVLRCCIAKGSWVVAPEEDDLVIGLDGLDDVFDATSRAPPPVDDDTEPLGGGNDGPSLPM